MSNIAAQTPYSKRKMGNIIQKKGNKLFKYTKKALVFLGRKLLKKTIKGFRLSKKAIIKVTARAIRLRKCKPKRVKHIMFSVFVFQVDNTKSTWPNLVGKVLASTEEVCHAEFDGRGFVLVSGFIDYKSILKGFARAGKKVVVHELKFGECCTDLYGLFLDMYPKNNLPMPEMYPNNLLQITNGK